MADYKSSIRPDKQMAMGMGEGAGDFGVDKLASHMGAAATLHASFPPNLPDHQRGHKGHHRRTERASLDGKYEQGGADHGPYSPDRIPKHV